MKDPTRPIRVAIGNRLKGAVTLAGKVVPVYDRVPEMAPSEYIRIGEQSFDDSLSLANCSIYEGLILLDIVTSFPGKGQGGKHETDLIADQVIRLLIPEQEYDLPLGNEFEWVDTALEMSVSNETQEPGFYKARRLLRFRIIVQQVNLIS